MKSTRSVYWAVALTWILFASGLAIGAAPSVSGQWHVEFATPQGERAVNMTINQSGTRLSGHVGDPYGEYELKGQMRGGEVTASWSAPEDGKLIEITMRGALKGNTIEGTAKIGDLGEGPLSARRTGDAGDR